MIAFANGFRLQHQSIPFGIQFFGFCHFDRFLGILPHGVGNFRFEIDKIFVLHGSGIDHLATVIQPQLFHGKALFEHLVAIQVELHQVEEAVIVRIRIFDSRKHGWLGLDAFRTVTVIDSAHSLIVTGILVDAPATPFGSVQVDLAVYRADIQLPVAGIVLIPFTPVTRRISLSVIVYSALVLSYLERIPRLVQLHAFPTVAIVVLIVGKPDLIPFTFLERQIPSSVMIRI